MKRYEFERFAVIAFLLWLLLLLCPPEAEASRNRGPFFPSYVGGRSKMACEPAKSIWLKNDCKQGFVIVRQNRVVAQSEGLTEHDKMVELKKEACRDLRFDPFHPRAVVKIRLFSPSAHRYICFNTKGRIRAVKRHQVERKRRRSSKRENLCYFVEEPIPDKVQTEAGGHTQASTYLSLQSAYNRRWYMGFGPLRLHKRYNNGRPHHIGITHTPLGHAVTVPRRMGPKYHRRASMPPNRCDFRFTIRDYQPVSLAAKEPRYSGLYSIPLLPEGASSSSSNQPNTVQKPADRLLQKRARKRARRRRVQQYSTRHYNNSNHHINAITDDQGARKSNKMDRNYTESISTLSYL